MPVSFSMLILYKASLRRTEQVSFAASHHLYTSLKTRKLGTKLGDLIEIQGINEVFHSSHATENPLIIGAAKTCVGHTETASGLVGVVKALASLSKGSVPGLTHLTPGNLNSAIDCSLIPMHIPHKEVALKRRDSVPLRSLVL